MQIPQGYPYAVARVRSLENGLLDRARVMRMLDSRTPEDVLRVLSELGYPEGTSDLPVSGYESIIAGHLLRTYRMIAEFSPARELVDLHRLVYDLHNVKVILKSRITGVDRPDLFSPLSIAPADQVVAAVGAENLSDLPSPVQTLIEAGIQQMSEGRDPQQLEFALDAAYYRVALGMALRLNSRFITEYYSIRIDISNILGFLRCRRMERDKGFFMNFLIPSGTLPRSVFLDLYSEPLDALVRKLQVTRYSAVVASWSAGAVEDASISRLERLFEDYVAEYVRGARYISLGPEPVFAYLLWVESDARIARTVLVGKVNNLDPETIRERLGDARA